MTETEVKVRWSGDADSARAHIEAHGFRLTGPRVLESDQLFDFPSGELRQSGKALRLRVSGGKATVTYKGPLQQGPYKSREEIEFEVSDPHAFELVLARLGYQPLFRYEKFRTKFAAAEGPVQGEVTLDETPIGILMELEGPGYWIESAAQALGYSRENFITASYAALYGEYRQSHPQAPADMLFQFSKP